MPASTYLKTKVIDHTLRATSFTSPAQVYVGLFTADPTADYVSANELQAGPAPWYARVLASFGAQSPAGTTSNSGTITFATVTTGSITVSHFGLFDSLTSVNMLYYGALSSPRTFNVSDVPSWLPGALIVTAV